MKIHNKLKILAVALTMSAFAVLGGCAADPENAGKDSEDEISSAETPEETLPPVSDREEPEVPSVTVPEVPVTQPNVKYADYIRISADGVNLRSGAGTNYSSAGTAQKNTLYPVAGREGGWIKTYHKGKTVYIYYGLCTDVHIAESENKKYEDVIGEGYRVLGTPYVYGAVRLHDGKGRLLGGFSVNAFDCSSLMQYMFYKGAGYNLDVNTRTQVYQGSEVAKKDLKRGDLLFFTNASRKDKKGIERIGHVAIYLGDNYILHTASDFAKIEQINQTRWGYYITAKRIL